MTPAAMPIFAPADVPAAADDDAAEPAWADSGVEDGSGPAALEADKGAALERADAEATAAVAADTDDTATGLAGLAAESAVAAGAAGLCWDAAVAAAVATVCTAVSGGCLVCCTGGPTPAMGAVLALALALGDGLVPVT